MNKFDILLWDLDDTLLDFGQSENHAITSCFDHFKIPYFKEMIDRYSAINLSYWKRFEKGEIAKQEVLYGRFRQLFQEFGIKNIQPEEFQLLYQEELGSTFFYNDDSFEICRKLSDDFNQYIVTNGIVITQEKKLRLSKFDQIMDGICISEKLGFQKPQAQFFEKCFELIGNVDKEKVLIIGDSLTSDIKGGNNAGIATCWYNPKKNECQENVVVNYEIDSLNQIFDIIY